MRRVRRPPLFLASLFIVGACNVPIGVLATTTAVGLDDGGSDAGGEDVGLAPTSDAGLESDGDDGGAPDGDVGDAGTNFDAAPDLDGGDGDG
jgi:hypothetical protein